MLREKLKQYPEVTQAAEKCLLSRRWQGNVAAMVIDAAITSTGVSYFTVVVPRVRTLMNRITSLQQLATLDISSQFHIWKNRRSWQIATQISRELLKFGTNDISALRNWASQTDVYSWSADVIGRIKGVGINTFQYLRMMGGVDTVMPDKIVRRFARNFGIDSKDDIEFVRDVEQFCRQAEIKAVEFCFLAWMLQYPQDKVKHYCQILRSI